jgi:microcystin degradation protein MlrC
MGGITAVVISDRTQTADPVFFTMMGLDIGAARAVAVKSRGHFRAGFDRWFAPGQVYEIDTGGLTSPVLSRWPLHNVPRPSYPLDPDMEWNGP